MIINEKTGILLLKKNTANNELKTGTKLVYNPDLEGPIFSTPFIKKICAKNDGKIIITPNIMKPFWPGKIN